MWRNSKRQVVVVAKARKPKWHAVEVLSSKTACPAAQGLKGKRFLSLEAPLFPLPQCTRSEVCACAYKKYQDRRAEDRREQNAAALRAMPLQDRRARRGRRKSDK
jgi:hypothetical protein